jgi:hypothetical protein
LQVKPHVPLLHVASAFAGTAQGVHAAPQDVSAVSEAQTPEQSCDPSGQTPVHDALSSIHAPAQGFFPEGQLAPHAVPLQVAVPPVRPGQATQAVPQCSGESSATQASSH